jgi:hypothetical protein
MYTYFMISNSATPFVLRFSKRQPKESYAKIVEIFTYIQQRERSPEHN